MLDEGAGTRDALALADELEHLGADLWLGSGRDGSQLSVQAPRETFFAALDIAADVLLPPAPRRRRLGARAGRSQDRHRAAARSARGGGQRRLRSPAVRRRAPLRPPGRGVRAHDRARHRSPTSRAFHAAHWRPEQRVARGGGRLRRRPACADGSRRRSATGPARPAPEPPAPPPGPRARASASSIGPARPRASCAWWRRGPIASRPIARGWRC